MSVRRDYDLRDGTLSVLHFGDVSKPLELVFLHANGFNAQTYRAVFESLGVHAVVFDMRGHGQSRDMPQPSNINNWYIFRDDCVEFFERYLPELTDGSVVLAGHSFGAVTAILASSFVKNRVSGYVGFDPVMIPLFFRLFSILPGGQAYIKHRLPIARNAGRRKSEFENPEAVFTRWQGRGAFKAMGDDVLRDYISGGLVERPDGQWELACAPQWEQKIFITQWHNTFKAARALPDNSKIVFAGERYSVSSKRTRAAIQAAQPNMRVMFDPKLQHLFPLYQPDLAKDMLRDVLNGR